MRFFFDARYIRTDFHDGISRYTTELGNAVAKVHDDVTFIISDEAQLAHLPPKAQFVVIHSVTSAKEALTALILNRFKPDVVFSPLQTMGTRGRRFKAILTIHDLIYFRHTKPPTWFSPIVRFGWRLYHLTYYPQRFILAATETVAVVSRCTERDLRDAKMTDKPIVVVYNAPRDLQALVPRAKQKMTAIKNLVYMGSFMPYKNVETLIAGMASLPGFTLHLLSRISPEREKELQALVPSGANVVFHRGVSDEAYAKLLLDNALLVNSSLDEGFGLPLAEAAALGVPQVVSDIPIFHEAAGDGALYFDPHSGDDFARAVKKAAHLPTYRTLQAKSRAHMNQFSWEKSAKALIRAAKKL